MTESELTHLEAQQERHRLILGQIISGGVTREARRYATCAASKAAELGAAFDAALADTANRESQDIDRARVNRLHRELQFSEDHRGKADAELANRTGVPFAELQPFMGGGVLSDESLATLRSRLPAPPGA